MFFNGDCFVCANAVATNTVNKKNSEALTKLRFNNIEFITAASLKKRLANGL